MRSGLRFGLIGFSLIAFAGCGEKDDDEMTYQSEPAACDGRRECEDDGVRVWRFPFVQIAIDPDDPKSVAVRVADDEDGHEFVDLGVSWDDD